MKNSTDLLKLLEVAQAQYEKGERGRPFQIVMKEIRQKLNLKSKIKRVKNK